MRRRLPTQVIVLGLVSLLNDAASEMIYPLLPILLTTTLGATPLLVGLIEGAAEAVASVLKYFAGRWSDRLPARKPLVVGGYSLAVIARLAVATASSWPVVLGARLGDRVGKGVRSAPRDAMISDATPAAERGRAYGFHRGLDHTGAVIGPLIALLLLHVAGVELRTMFVLAAIPGVLGVLLLVFVLKEPARTPSRTTSPATSKNAPLPPAFWRALAPIALFALANSSDVFLLLQAHAAGVSASMLPLLWAAHHVVKALFSSRAGALSDRIDRRFLLAGGWSVYGVIYLLFPAATSLTWFLLLFILYAIPFTLTEGAERAWISDLVPAESRGRSFGIYYLVSGVGVLAGTALFGLLFQYGSARLAFIAGAALALTAATVVLLGPRRRDA